MPRSLCSEVNRMVTCLEATEMGYSFIQTYSKCDYYLQNRALSAKALKLPRSELSAMWQCTAKHKVGDLNCHAGNNTPYRPALVMKYNSFLCSNNDGRRINSNEVSGGKQVQLFEETPTIECGERIALPSTTALISTESMLVQRGRWIKERDEAIAEQTNLRQRLQAVEEERDQARLEVEMAAVEGAKQRRVLESEISILRQRCNELTEQNELLQQTLVQCQQKQSNLCSRVSTLEVQQESQLKNYLVICWGLPLVSILNSIKAILPERKLNAAVKDVFDMLYVNKKFFHYYVNKKAKEFLHPLLRMDICMEIRQLFLCSMLVYCYVFNFE
jgi:hypothetical protein